MPKDNLKVYYVLDEDKDDIVEKTTDRGEAFEKADELWDEGTRGSVAKGPC